MSKKKTAVICCAGFGSRLDFNKPKTLVEFLGKPLIHWQLEALREIEDVRLVVGYHAHVVIETAQQVRKDLTFVHNYDFFRSNVADSLYLGSRDSEDYVISIDGDLVIHPDDMAMCLNASHEFVGISDTSSDKPINVILDAQGDKIVGFSNEPGTYEMTTPYCIHKNKIEKDTNLDVYELFEKYFPVDKLYVRAMDFDTIHDYRKAEAMMQRWHNT